MSINVGFFHETFDGQQWVSERPGRIFGTGPFLWLKTKQYDWIPLDALFFQPGALIPFRNGLPPDQPPSRLRSALAEIGGDVRWLPVQDLFLDDWDTEALLLSRWVPARLAPLFGDGQAPFPQEALVQHGMSPREIRVIRCGVPVEASVSRLWGRGLEETRQVAGDALLEVTWVDSVEGYLGEATVTAFRSLRNDHRQARVIAWQEA